MNTSNTSDRDVIEAKKLITEGKKLIDSLRSILAKTSKNKGKKDDE